MPANLFKVFIFATLCLTLTAGVCAEVPPVMIHRSIAPPESEPGTRIELDLITTGTITLYLPENFQIPQGDSQEVTMHFHGATWFAIQEHERRGLSEPLVAFELGQGSTVYKTPFLDRTFFATVLKRVEQELKNHGASNDLTIDVVNLTSFSAGYGAIREIVKSPEYVEKIQRIILADSSYASLESEELENGNRIVDMADAQSWVDYGTIAKTGEKTLLMLSSDIMPPNYAGTMEVCRSVANTLGVEVKEIPTNQTDESGELIPYQLHSVASEGGFQWWGYQGDDAQIHMIIARRIAEAWLVLDEMGMP